MDKIIGFNEIYEDAIHGQYIFFASSDEGYTCYTYWKDDEKLYAFPTDCGVESISGGTLCANNLSGLIEYLKCEPQPFNHDKSDFYHVCECFKWHTLSNKNLDDDLDLE